MRKRRKSNPIALLAGAMFFQGLLTVGIAYEFCRLLDYHRQIYATHETMPTAKVAVAEPEPCSEPAPTATTVRPEPRRETPPPQAESVSRIERMLVTAYCPCKKCCGRWARNRRTALGDSALVFDGVAAAFSMLAPRTQLIIPGVGVKEVDDTGGGMRQSAERGITHVDLRMRTHEEALRWGVKRLPVRIITSGR